MEELMVRIDNISKQYILGQIGGTTLRDELQRLHAKRQGKEDPTSQIGSKPFRAGETFLALDGVSFDVRKGERVGIIGHNGAGKSTLLKLISRVTSPSSGMIGLNGRVASMLEVGTGFHQELTGRENIYMNGAILGMTKKEIEAKMEDIIEFSECRQFIDTPVKRYSSGMYVKLAFSVAAHLDAEIMIMDEVLAVGDVAFQKKCLEKMGAVSKTEGRTILYVSHNMNTIRQLCNRVVVLDHGKLVFDGDVEEGIGVYTEVNADSRTFYDLTEAVRQAACNRKIEMRSLTITGRSSNQLTRRENLSFILNCQAHTDIEKAFLRFETYFSDDTLVGTSFSDQAVSARKGELLDIHVDMNMENYVTGRYRCIALLFQIDERGNQSLFDRVDPAITFEIIQDSSGDLVWLHKWWGHIRLKDLQIKKVEHLDAAVNPERKAQNT